MHARVLAYVKQSKLDSFRERIGKKLPQFRYVDSVENTNQPERYDVLVKINYNSTNDLVATVHDRKTGAPLYSCSGNCELKVDKRSKRFLVLSRQGYEPHFSDQLYHGGGRSSIEIIAPKDSLFQNYYTDPSDLKQCSKLVVTSPEICPTLFHRRILTTNPWSLSPNGYGRCDAQFDVTNEGVVRNVRDLQCDNLNLCYYAFVHFKKTLYHPTGQSYSNKREIKFHNKDMSGNAKNTENGDAEAAAKYECFPK